MELAARHRSVCQTGMNERSSRSHSVFALHLKAAHAGQGIVLNGTLSLVDLAGSERVDRSMVTGAQLKETVAINKSLSALADVFVAIGNKQPHIPFRNSKLTYLLQPALSGDGKTLMVSRMLCMLSTHYTLPIHYPYPDLTVAGESVSHGGVLLRVALLAATGQAGEPVRAGQAEEAAAGHGAGRQHQQQPEPRQPRLRPALLLLLQLLLLLLRGRLSAGLHPHAHSAPQEIGQRPGNCQCQRIRSGCRGGRR